MLYRLPLFSIAIALILSPGTHAQSQWVWAKTDAAASYSINPSYPRQVIAAHNGHALWGVIQNRKMTYGQVMLGDYKLYDYDASGSIGASTLITGKISLTAARADGAGNWYVLGTFYDSITLSNGMSLVRTVTGSEHFLLRLRAGTLVPDWIRPVGDNSFCGTDCFTIVHGNIVLPIDSSYGTAICAFNAVTGARTTLWSQSGRSYTSYIDGDDRGNIYLMGHCALSGGVSFNGTPSPSMPSAQYPWYIVRYRITGQHHWHYWLTDMTCIPRSFLLGDRNSVYLSGPLADSTSLGAHQFTKPSGFFNADFLLARLDSNGSLIWAQQRPLTSAAQGNLYFSSAHHMASVDTSLYMFCETQGASIWGAGIATQTANNRHNGTLVAYGKSGPAVWGRTIGASYSIAQQIATDGSDIWVTGVGADSATLRFDSVSIPTVPGPYIPYLAKMRLKTPVATAILSRGRTAAPISFWPNPAKTVLHIGSVTPQQLAIRDLTGRVMWWARMPGTSTQVETSAWPRGWYLLESNGSEGRWMTKVLLD